MDNPRVQGQALCLPRWIMGEPYFGNRIPGNHIEGNHKGCPYEDR